MSFVHRVDNDQQVVVFVAGTDVSEADLQGQWSNPAWSDPEISQYAVLADLRLTRHVSISLSALRAFAWQVRFQSKRSRPRVALVAEGGVAYGMAKVFQSMRREVDGDEVSTLVFRELGEAVEWLGLPAAWMPPPFVARETGPSRPRVTGGRARAEEQLAGVLTSAADMPEWALPLAAEVHSLRGELDTLRGAVRRVYDALAGVPGAEALRSDLLNSLGSRSQRGH